jgi:transposase
MAVCVLTGRWQHIIVRLERCFRRSGWARAKAMLIYPLMVLPGKLTFEERVPKDHPLSAIRALADAVLKELSRQFDTLYSHTGRPSIAPQKWLRALLLQVLYTIRSERLLMEQLDYALLFRWFVRPIMDDAVWDPTVFSKNRDRWPGRWRRRSSTKC